MALAAAVEALAKGWTADPNSSDRFKTFLRDVLPAYCWTDAAGGELRRIRGRSLQEGFVFADDWIDRPDDDDLLEESAHLALAMAARLAAVNWIRSRSGLPLIPPNTK